jgi:hypothetical protein
MNTNIRAQKSKNLIPSPSPAVRTLCSLILIAPVFFGACLALQNSAPFKFRLTLLKFVQDKKIPPARFPAAHLPIPVCNNPKHSTTR